MANWEVMIKPYPRYQDLLLKRGRFVFAGSSWPGSPAE